MKILTRNEIIEFIKDAEKNGRVLLYDSTGGIDNDIYDGYKTYEEWRKENNEDFINLFSDDIYKIYTAYLTAVNVLQSINTEEEMKMFNDGKDVKKKESTDSIHYNFEDVIDVNVDKNRKNTVMITIHWFHEKFVCNKLNYIFVFENKSLKKIEKYVFEDVLVKTEFFKIREFKKID